MKSSVKIAGMATVLLAIGAMFISCSKKDAGAKSGGEAQKVVRINYQTGNLRGWATPRSRI